MQLAPRADLFRLLGDEDRLRLLALCSEEELTVGELAALLDESQPQITKKSQPLREAGLLSSRRDGTRTLLRTVPSDDIVIDSALSEGERLCAKDGSLARIPGVIAQREEQSRRFFEQASSEPLPPPSELATWLPMLAPLLPRTELAVDIGTGEGTLLPLLSPIYGRVVAVDRSAARLARCAAMIAEQGLPNVRLHEGDVDDASLLQDITARGGADLVVMARVLHHAARPHDAIVAATRLLHVHGHLVIVDYLPHDDESMREQGDVWLGFEPEKLRGWMWNLDILVARPFSSTHKPALQIIVGKKRTS
jgi:DNA-binding transcriptional ArsR family regulator